MERRDFLRTLGLAPAIAIGVSGTREVSEAEAIEALALKTSRVEHVPLPPMPAWLVELMDDPDKWARDKAQAVMAEHGSTPYLEGQASGAVSLEMMENLESLNIGPIFPESVA